MLIQEIRKQRLLQINKILNNFSDLPPSLQHEKYKKYLIDTKEMIQPVVKELVVPFNKVGRIIGQGGCVLKQIEKDYNCRIKIDSSSKTESIVNIEGDNAKEVVKYIEDIIYNTKKNFDIEKMTDWEKYYVWWAYHNKKNV